MPIIASGAGPAGKDGISCTHEWVGTTLYITSASGTTSADLKGQDGVIGEDGIGVSSISFNSATNKWDIRYTNGTVESINGPVIPDVDDFMPISGGTFTGAVYAGSSSQSGSAYLLRNSKLSISTEIPTVNGQICWRLK